MGTLMSPQLVRSDGCTNETFSGKSCSDSSHWLKSWWQTIGGFRKFPGEGLYETQQLSGIAMGQDHKTDFHHGTPSAHKALLPDRAPIPRARQVEQPAALGPTLRPTREASEMAVAFDAVTLSSAIVGAGGPFSWMHTPIGAPTGVAGMLMNRRPKRRLHQVWP